MTTSDFKFNIKICGMLLAAVFIAVPLYSTGAIQSDLYVQFVLAAFAGFALFRVVFPFVFTKLDPYGTPEMQENTRKHPLGKYFLIEDQD